MTYDLHSGYACSSNNVSNQVTKFNEQCLMGTPNIAMKTAFLSNGLNKIALPAAPTASHRPFSYCACLTCTYFTYNSPVKPLEGEQIHSEPLTLFIHFEELWQLAVSHSSIKSSSQFTPEKSGT